MSFNKKMLIVIALIGIGLWALPSTMSLFAGQHSFENIDATGNQIDCVKCHGDVKAELTGSGVSLITGTKPPHSDFQCEYCHRMEAGKASGDNSYSSLSYTAVGSDGLTVTRKLVTTVTNMEARNFPATMTGADTNATLAELSTVSGVTSKTSYGKLQFSVSPCYPAVNLGCSEPVVFVAPTALGSSAWRTTTLYVAGSLDSSKTDQNPTTVVGIFDPTKVTWTAGIAGVSQTINLTNAGSRVSNPGTAYHAATLVSCLECHGGNVPSAHESYGQACGACHYSAGSKSLTEFIKAGGFGLTGDAGDTGAAEAHTAFVTNNDGILRYNTVYEASNTACVACHTHVAVDIAYDKPTGIQMDVTLDRNGGDAMFYNEVAGGSSTTYSGVGGVQTDLPTQ